MKCPIVTATLTLLPELERPRNTGWRGYRPHIVVEPLTPDMATRRANMATDRYQSVVFLDEYVTIAPGDTKEVILGLWAYPDNQYENVIPGATFTLREGPHIAGYGTITDRS
jgi:hypothetical protein